MSLNSPFRASLEAQIQDLKEQKVYKRLNHLSSPQAAHVKMEGRGHTGGAIYTRASPERAQVLRWIGEGAAP